MITPDPGTKNLLTVTAVIEGPTGLALMAAPSFVSELLLGSSLDTSVPLTIGRVAGAAVFALSLACWFARHDGQGRAVVSAMTFYNVAIILLFVYGSLSLGLSSIGLWPAVLVHAGMTAWCIKYLSRIASA